MHLLLTMRTRFSDLPERRSIRLKSRNYSQPGQYFVTIVTHERAELFGQVADGSMQLSPAGECVFEVWTTLPRHYRHIALDAFVVMPNHVHGIVQIGPPGSVGQKSSPLSEIIRGIKTYSARRVNLLRGMSGTPVWQRNYHERVIRDSQELENVRRYIVANPLAWANDPENPIAHC